MEAIRQELQFVGVSFFWGIILLVAYDCFRIARNCIAHSKWVVAIEDFLFWILAGCSAFFVMYKMNQGIIRVFSIMAILIGMIAYRHTVSLYFVKYSTIGIYKIQKIAKTIIGFILSPGIFVAKRFFWTFQWIFKKGKRALKFFVKSLQKVRKKVKIISTKQ